MLAKVEMKVAMVMAVKINHNAVIHVSDAIDHVNKAEMVQNRFVKLNLNLICFETDFIFLLTDSVFSFLSIFREVMVVNKCKTP